MPATALFAVLAAALLHASWNLVVKGSSERLVAAAAQVVLGGLVFLPVVIWRGYPLEVFGYLFASALVQVAYIYTLSTAYDRADLSFVYPLARGTAPLLLAVAGLLGLAGAAVSGQGWLALAMICGGVIALGLSAESHRGVGWSLLTGLLIATYIGIDGTGVRGTDDTFAYTAALYASTAVLLFPLTLVMRGAETVRRALRLEWKRHLVAGAAGLGSYGLLLYASRLAPLSLVAAARETGVVFATIGGWWFLNERVTRGRAAASMLIAAGVTLLALGR
ncbi:MAG TPA: EamA family transporter [Acidimicrobiia bacterium]|nr:EamA family transporter [Acidimicrobiia bacterium]